MSGFIYIKNGVPIIGVNSLHHPNRQRFTIAHEIAHLELHREHTSSEVHVDKQFSENMLKRDRSSASGTQWLEIETNQFAAVLLMPGFILEDMLEQSPIDIEDEDSLEEWAGEFNTRRGTFMTSVRTPSDRLTMP